MDWRFLQQKARDQAQESGGSAARRPRRRVRQLALVVGVVAVFAVGAGAWYFSSQSGGTSRNSTVNSRPSLASNALRTAQDVGTFLRENVTRDIGNIATLLRRPGSDDEAETPDEEALSLEAEAEDASTGAPRTVRRRRREPTAPPEIHAGVEALPSAEVSLERPLFMVFDNSYADVTPPGAGAIRLRGEFLPGDPLIATSAELEALSRPDLANENVGLVEVVISETGEVERAKLISAPANVHESMLLSAIKAWRFVPAEKDGQAVRYPAGDADYRRTVGPQVQKVSKAAAMTPFCRRRGWLSLRAKDATELSPVRRGRRRPPPIRRRRTDRAIPMRGPSAARSPDELLPREPDLSLSC